MKRVMLSVQSGIFGMSFPRKDALAKMSSLSEIINKHIIECVVYKELRYNTITHWVDELAAWMNRANKIKCNSKLKEQDYVEALFGSLGNDIIDADVNLDEYKRKNLELPEDKQYPDFEITQRLIYDTYQAYQAVIKKSLPILMSKDILSAADWSRILINIFK